MKFPNFWNLVDQQCIKVFQNNSQYVFSSDEKEHEDLYPYIGNGYIATQVGSPWIFIDGVYNGKEDASHRAGIPSTVAWVPLLADSTRKSYLNIGAGIFLDIYKNDSFRVFSLTFACRNVPNVIIKHIEIDFLEETLDKFCLKSDQNIDLQSPDFEIFKNYTKGSLVCIHGTAYETENEQILAEPSKFFLVHDPVPGPNCEGFELTRQRNSRTFVSSYSRYSIDEAHAFYEETIGRTVEGIEALLLAHTSQWLHLWLQGSIIVTPKNEKSNYILNESVETNDTENSSLSEDWEIIPKDYPDVTGEKDQEDEILLGTCHLAQYSIMSCLPSVLSVGEQLHDTEVQFYSLSPVGLARGMIEDDYMGHVFWDQEFWMLPWINVFHPKLAQLCLDYRFKTLETAKGIAKSHGEFGARFAWESARTGCETCVWKDCGEKEIHVNGCISWAICQWLIAHATPMANDSSVSKEFSELSFVEKESVCQGFNWYKLYGSKLLYELARFWQSRLVPNRDRGTFDILHVMPPDEYVHDCNNSAFTNVIAEEALKAPLKMFHWLNRNPDASASSIYSQDEYNDMLEWSVDSTQIYLPKNVESSIILEHEDYKMNTTVKQADVVLLEYPICKQLPYKYRKNTLEYYASVSSETGPAMTWSIFTICALQMNNPELAASYFSRNFNYIRGPFFNWTEVALGVGATNFLTGAGGFLQSILNGYCGLRYRLYDCIHLPKKSDSREFCVNDGDSGSALILRFNWSIPEPGSKFGDDSMSNGITLNGVKFHSRSLQLRIYYQPLLKVQVELTQGSPIRLFSGNLDYNQLLMNSNIDLNGSKINCILDKQYPKHSFESRNKEDIILLFID